MMFDFLTDLHTDINIYVKPSSTSINQAYINTLMCSVLLFLPDIFIDFKPVNILDHWIMKTFQTSFDSMFAKLINLYFLQAHFQTCSINFHSYICIPAKFYGPKDPHYLDFYMHIKKLNSTIWTDSQIVLFWVIYNQIWFNYRFSI